MSAPRPTVAQRSRAKRVHFDAATPYAHLMDNLLDVGEEAVPQLPTDLLRLAFQFADFDQSYRVLPRGPVQLRSVRAMPASMTDWTPPDDSPDSATVRRLLFRGGGGLVLSSPLFERSRKRKRDAGVDAHANAGANTDAAARNELIVEDAPSAASASATPDIVAACDAGHPNFTHACLAQGAWHIVPFLLGASALQYDPVHGWIVVMEMTMPQSLLDKVNIQHARLTVKDAQFELLHQYQFAYYRSPPFGINLIYAESQLGVGSDFPHTVTSEEATSFCVRGHEGDHAKAGITLVYADAKGSARSAIESSQHSPSSAAAVNATDECQRVRVSRAYRVAPPTWRADELLSAQSAQAYFQRASRCEFGVAPCRERVDPTCWRSCCSAEHCAQASGGAACIAHQE